MPRIPRLFSLSFNGSYHIMSRIISDIESLDSNEKSKLLKILEVTASAYYVDIQAFCIMDNHFHILLVSRAQETLTASWQELRARYKLLCGKSAEPPEGGQDCYGQYYVDDDGGFERLRARLASVSDFVKELKLSFTKWYNKRHQRKGPLWRDRFRSVNIHAGDVQMICSSYIELNPVRAGILYAPDKYNWSSLGLRSREPKRAKKLLTPLSPAVVGSTIGIKVKSFSLKNRERLEFNWYRAFVYKAGSVEGEGKASIPRHIAQQVKEVSDALKISGRLNRRMRNLTDSVAIGAASEINELQKKLNRKHQNPRSFLKDAPWAFATRCLKEKETETKVSA